MRRDLRVPGADPPEPRRGDAAHAPLPGATAAIAAAPPAHVP